MSEHSPEQIPIEKLPEKNSWNDLKPRRPMKKDTWVTPGYLVELEACGQIEGHAPDSPHGDDPLGIPIDPFALMACIDRLAQPPPRPRPDQQV
jgi:hypothetical protein